MSRHRAVPSEGAAAHPSETRSSEVDSDDELASRESDGAADCAGEEGWRNKEGERLNDFGVDEVADFYDEDDAPLADFVRNRNG